MGKVEKIEFSILHNINYDSNNNTKKRVLLGVFF
jgi:hypothetical protein